MRRPGLALAGVAVIVAGMGILFGWWSRSGQESVVELAGVDRIRVEGSSPTVTVRAADVPATTVRQEVSSWWFEPDDVFSQDGGDLVLRDCGMWCSVSYDVTIPLHATVSGNVTSGDLTIRSVAEVDVSTTSGNIRMRDIAGAVTAKATSGDIIGEELLGPVDASTSSGNIRLHHEVPQDVVAEVNSGNIELTVPRGQYRIEGDSGSGNRDIAVASDPAAGPVLQLDSSSGNVTVQPD